MCEKTCKLVYTGLMNERKKLGNTTVLKERVHSKIIALIIASNEIGLIKIWPIRKRKLYLKLSINITTNSASVVALSVILQILTVPKVKLLTSNYWIRLAKWG